VADSGPGLSATQAARVFDRFYRTDRARSRASGGTGLGLSIAGTLVAAHGGTIEVDTQPGHGATFLVRLPLAAAPADGGPPEPREDVSGPASDLPGPAGREPARHGG
jgi:two-component system OmpR family sensor kinase